MVFADYLAAHANLLHQRVALERVAVQGSPEPSFLGSEFANDVLDLRRTQRR